MASIQPVIRQFLEADSTLTTAAQGGIYDASELGRQGLRPDTPGLYNGERLQPCIVLRWRGAGVYGPHYSPQSERRTFEAYFYEDDGNTTLETMKHRVKTLLHRTQHTADTGGLWWVNWISDFGEFRALELGGAAADFSRYEVIYTRS